MFWPLFFASGIAGFIGALDGIGGGLVLTPLLTLLGVDIREAIAISAVSVVAISNSAAPVFLRRHLPNLKAVAFFELFAVTGAFAGGVLAGISSRRWLFFFCASLMLISWTALWRKWKGKPPLPSPDPIAPGRESMLRGSYYDPDSGKTVLYEGRHPRLGILCMFGVGLIGGILGGGGGIFAVLAMDLVMGFPTKVALTMSNLMMGVIALASLSTYLEVGTIHTGRMIPVVLGALPGAFLGAKVLWRLKSQWVRTVFLCVLLVLCFRMVLAGFHAQ